MFAVICNPIFYREIEKAVISKGDQILVKAIDTDVDILVEFDKIGRNPIKHLIIDITSIQDTKKLLKAIKRYRIKNDKTQIIIIAPNVETPNTLMDALVTMGVYDIIAPAADNLEDIILLPSLMEVLEVPSSFKKAVKWFLDNEEKDYQEDSTSKTTKSKSEKEVIERTVTITKEKIVGTVVIAITGTMKRIGTTHTTLEIATFLKNNNFKVAALEYHKSENFNTIKNNYEDVIEKDNCFLIDGINYYPYSDDLNVLDVLQRDYNYIIIDMGQYKECDLTEFKRANIRIVVSGVKDWELTDLELILRSGDTITNNKNIYYFNFSDKETFESIKANMIDEKMGQFKCYQAPLNPNPFTVSKECILLFKELLKDVLPEIKQADISKNKGVFNTAKGLFDKFKKEGDNNIEA